jgi:hypothetical protein
VKTFAALFLPLIATWLAAAAWSLIAIHSPLLLPHGAINYGPTAMSTLILVLVPFLWVAAWIFRRVVTAHRVAWAFAAAAIALAALIAPALFTPMEWALPTVGFAVGYLLLFPALVAVMGTPHR